MATHPDSVRTSIADGVVDQLDLGATNATARFIFQTVADAELATLNMSDPAFGAASVGVATAGTIADDTTATGGDDTTKCILTDKDNNTIIEGTVGLVASGADIEMSDLTIPVGATVQISDFLTYTAPL